MPPFFLSANSLCLAGGPTALIQFMRALYNHLFSASQ